MLDPTMTYSSGVYDSPTSTLEQASIEKYDRICRKLRLSREDHVLEIGTGCGYAAAIMAELVAEVYSLETVSRLNTEPGEAPLIQPSAGAAPAMRKKIHRGQFRPIEEFEFQQRLILQQSVDRTLERR